MCRGVGRRRSCRRGVGRAVVDDGGWYGSGPPSSPLKVSFVLEGLVGVSYRVWASANPVIYCDYNAATPMRPEVLEAMLPYLRDDFGNPSSVHALGSRARCAIEEARSHVAMLLGCNASELVFTSGGTESNNLALRGILATPGAGGLVTTAIEHASILEPAAELRSLGVRVLQLAVDAEGRVDPEQLAAGLGDDTGLVSVGWANNEIGAIQPMVAVAAVCRARGVLVHSDAVQAVGKLAVAADSVDLLSLSAHKLGGPKGVGALYVRRGVVLQAGLRGGGQERGRRAGTENVAAIVGFGEACRLVKREGQAVWQRVAELRNDLWRRLRPIAGAHRQAGADGCLPNTLNVRFDGVRGEALVAALDLEGIAVSSGSACAAGAGEPSHVLMALGLPEDMARDGVRFSLGSESTALDVEGIASAVMSLVDRMRATCRYEVAV